MFITVMYRGGKIGMVRVNQLEHLIHSHKIDKFMRSEGWVTIGIDSTRKCNEDCNSPERRHNFFRTT